MSEPKAAHEPWALGRLKELLGYLTDEDLLQTIATTASLPSADQAADNFKVTLPWVVAQ